MTSYELTIFNYALQKYFTREAVQAALSATADLDQSVGYEASMAS